jgi:uncharacterized protein (DUF433 family)
VTPPQQFLILPDLRQAAAVACKHIKILNYYKRKWEETTGDDLTNSWGVSTYYFETDDVGTVKRQLQLFEKGQVLKYDTDYIEDKFGGLSEVSLDLEEFNLYYIPSDEFERIWSSMSYRRFPEIVFTEDVLWGQPRLEGRRLAVGDIVSHVDVNRNVHVAADDYEITLQQVGQVLRYCASLQCEKDMILKYCHNCTLRVRQDSGGDGKEQDNWIRANRLLKEFFPCKYD